MIAGLSSYFIDRVSPIPTAAKWSLSIVGMGFPSKVVVDSCNSLPEFQDLLLSATASLVLNNKPGLLLANPLREVSLPIP